MPASARVASGELVRVLPEWRSAPVSMWAVFAGRWLMPVRTRVFIDALVGRFKECDGRGLAPAVGEPASSRPKAAKRSRRARRNS